jgi:hypothetical protein
VIRSGQRWLLTATIAVLLTACSDGVAGTPVPTAIPAAAIATTVPAGTATPGPRVTPTTAATTTAVVATSEEASLAARPLHLPTFAAGAPCPVTAWQPASNLDRADFKPTWSYFAFGPGPVYPIIYQFDPASRTVHPARDAVSGWRSDKVLWLIAPTYRGRTLVRGQRLDPAAPLSFFQGRAGSTTQTSAFSISTERRSAGWQTSGSGIRFPAQAGGCYAFQVDGLTFSAVIVFAVAG